MLPTLPTPTLIYPPEGFATARDAEWAANPHLEWAFDGPSDVGFELAVGRAPDVDWSGLLLDRLMQPKLAPSTTSYPHAGLDGPRAWQVRARRGEEVSEWSSVRTFTLGAPVDPLPRALLEERAGAWIKRYFRGGGRPQGARYQVFPSTESPPVWQVEIDGSPRLSDVAIQLEAIVEAARQSRALLTAHGQAEQMLRASHPEMLVDVAHPASIALERQRQTSSHHEVVLVGQRLSVLQTENPQGKGMLTVWPEGGWPLWAVTYTPVPDLDEWTVDGSFVRLKSCESRHTLPLLELLAKLAEAKGKRLYADKECVYELLHEPSLARFASDRPLPPPPPPEFAFHTLPIPKDVLRLCRLFEFVPPPLVLGGLSVRWPDKGEFPLAHDDGWTVSAARPEKCMECSWTADLDGRRVELSALITPDFLRLIQSRKVTELMARERLAKQE